MLVLYFFAPQVAFDTVPTKEELADVGADTVLEDKAAAGMLVDILRDIQHQWIKNDETLTLIDARSKLLFRHIFRNLICSFESHLGL